jgi:hypothetical protein
METNADSSKETVIIVHGTWAEPKSGTSQWYQFALDGSPCFVARLDAALQARGSSARCWAHCRGENEGFCWSGDNSWIERARASSQLAAYVNKLQDDGWRCHLVAHSHGGNIVLDAVPRIAVPSHMEPGVVVTLGTPFFDAMEPIESRRKRSQTIRRIADWSVGLLLLGAALFGFYGLYEETRIHGSRLFSSGEGGVGITIAIVPLIALVLKLASSLKRYRSRAKFKVFEPVWLAIGSKMDEAWQVLHHLRRLENPLLSQASLMAYLLDYSRSRLARSAAISRIHGARSFRDLTVAGRIGYVIVVALGLLWIAVAATIQPHHLVNNQSYTEFAFIGTTFWIALLLWSILVFGWPFYSSLWSPVRWVVRQGAMLANIPSEIGSYFVRKKAWTLIQASAMGLDGYDYALPELDVRPRRSAAAVTSEQLPEHVARRALLRRDAWLTGHFSAVSETFSQMTVTSADISALLKIVETDMTLVHAAYYVEEECTDRIADWIAGAEGSHSNA